MPSHHCSACQQQQEDQRDAILCVVVTAAAAVLQMIKDQMDKKFGSPWHVIVGRAFAYEITYEVRTQDRQQLGVGIVPAGM